MRPQILLICVAAACASAPESSSESSLVLNSDGPCAIQADAIDTADWQQVRGPGFVFCVPHDWRPSGSCGWIGPDGGVGWTPGRIAAFTSDVELGQPDVAPPMTYGKREHFTESIGGVMVQMWRTEVGTRNHVGGQWVDRVTMHMTVSQNAAALDRNADVLRTVRITSAPSQ